MNYDMHVWAKELTQKGHYDDAKKIYENLIETRDDIAMNNLAYYYQHIAKDNKQAIKYYEMAKEIDKKDSTFNLACLLYNLGDSDGFIENMEIARIAGNLNAYDSLIGYYHSIKDFDNVEKYCKLAINDNVAECYSDLITCLIQVGKLDDAKVEYFNAIKNGVCIDEKFDGLNFTPHEENELINLLNTCRKIIYKKDSQTGKIIKDATTLGLKSI